MRPYKSFFSSSDSSGLADKPSVTYRSCCKTMKWNLRIHFGASHLVLSTNLTWYRPCVESTLGSEVSDGSMPHGVQEFGHAHLRQIFIFIIKTFSGLLSGCCYFLLFSFYSAELLRAVRLLKVLALPIKLVLKLFSGCGCLHHRGFGIKPPPARGWNGLYFWRKAAWCQAAGATHIIGVSPGDLYESLNHTTWCHTVLC